MGRAQRAARERSSWDSASASAPVGVSGLAEGPRVRCSRGGTRGRREPRRRGTDRCSRRSRDRGAGRDRPVRPRLAGALRGESPTCWRACRPDSSCASSTSAAPPCRGSAAKPIVDMLVEVPTSPRCGAEVVPILEAQGYEYFWRPTHGDDGPPFYAWFIKRDPATGERTHHIHMVEASFAEHWDGLLFRDYLRAPRDRRGVRAAQARARRRVPERPRALHGGEVRVHRGCDGARAVGTDRGSGGERGADMLIFWSRTVAR